MNRKEMLKRIALGPTQFVELANGSTRHLSRARKNAKSIIDELINEGLIVKVMIGVYPYYILNTEKAKQQAIKQQIDERSKSNKESGCIIWTGFGIEGNPYATSSIFGKSSNINVRRWLFSDLIKRELNPSIDRIKVRADCDDMCINTEHMYLTSQSDVTKNIKKTLTAKINMHKKAKARHKTTDAMIEDIRSSDETNQAIADRLGMSKSGVFQIRKMKTHKFSFTNNPFAGLGAR